MSLLSPARPRADVPTLRDRQREETRRRVFEAALQVFRRDGVEKCHIDDIAREASVSRGTFYFHFPTKEDVLLTLFAESEARVVEELRRFPEDLSLPQLLARVCDAVLAEWQPDPTLFPAVGAVAVRRITSSRPMAQEQPIRALLAERFRTAADHGNLTTPQPPEILSDLFLINVFAAIMSWCGAPDRPLEPTLRAVVVFFLRGMGLPTEV